MTDPIQSIAMAAGLGWASGIRLYGVLFALGLLGSLDMMTLPEHLQVLTHPVVLWTSGFLFIVEFLADKIPIVDSLWDSVHTFIRIPAGALLAAASVGNIDSEWTLAAGLLGGALASGSHFTKAGTRALINVSPEPFSNWAASLSEDVLVAGGLWTAFQHPVAFLIALALLVLAGLWLAPRLWRAIKRLATRLGDLLRNH
jgi:hypothetical protein